MAAGIMHVKSISSVDSETRNKPAAGTSTSLDEDVSDHSYFSTELDSVKSDRIQRRKFRMSWKNTFSWLCYDNVKDVMFCKACREVLSSEYADEPYVEGTRDFRITAIQNHEMSRIHVSAVKKKILIKKKASKKIKVDKEEETTEKPKSVENDRKPQVKIYPLFMIAYEIQKLKLPVSNFFERYRKYENSEMLTKILDNSYYRLVSKITSAIEESLTATLIRELASAACIGLVFDIVTDNRHLVYITYVKDGKMMMKYLTEMDSLTSENDIQVVTNLLIEYGVQEPAEKVVAVTGDCCYSIMENADQHLLALKQTFPNAFFFNALVYKLEKFVEKCLEKNEDGCSVHTVLRRLSSLIQNSSFSDENFLAVLQKDFVQTGWDLNHKFLKTVHENWSKIVQGLEEIQLLEIQSEVSDILEIFKSDSFIVELAFYTDMFFTLSRVVDKILKANVPSYQIIHELEATACTILYHLPHGSTMIENTFTTLESQPGTYRDIAIKNTLDRNIFLHKTKCLASSVAESIRTITFTSTPLLLKYSVLDPKTWPVDEYELDNFGFTSIKLLSKLCDDASVDICQEWCSYKRTIIHSFPKTLGEKFETLALRVISSFHSLYPGITILLNRNVVLTPASCFAQEVFHRFYAKTADDTNSFSSKVIGINGAPLNQWNPSEAMEMWYRNIEHDENITFDKSKYLEFSMNIGTVCSQVLVEPSVVPEVSNIEEVI